MSLMNPQHPLRVETRKAKEDEERRKIEETAAFSERARRHLEVAKERRSRPPKSEDEIKADRERSSAIARKVDQEYLEAHPDQVEIRAANERKMEQKWKEEHPDEAARQDALSALLDGLQGGRKSTDSDS